MVTKIQQMSETQSMQPDDEGAAHHLKFQKIPPSAVVEYINADLAPAVPSEALLGSLRDGRLRVHSPIKVKFATEGKHTIAEAVELNEFGFGKNLSAAIIDLQRAIAELYLTLEKEHDRLGKDLQDVWTILQEKIHKR